MSLTGNRSRYNYLTCCHNAPSAASSCVSDLMFLCGCFLLSCFSLPCNFSTWSFEPLCLWEKFNDSVSLNFEIKSLNKFTYINLIWCCHSIIFRHGFKNCNFRDFRSGVGNLYALKGRFKVRKLGKSPQEQNLKYYYSINIVILFYKYTYCIIKIQKKCSTADTETITAGNW